MNCKIHLSLSVLIALHAIVFPSLVSESKAAESRADPRILSIGDGKAMPIQPQVFVDQDGQIAIAYSMGEEIQVTRSQDRGLTYRDAQATIHCPNISSGMRRGPRVVLNREAIIVTAIGGKQGKGKDGDVLAWASHDGGKSWTGPIRVNDVVDSAREGLHAMTIDSKGTITCVWLDLRNKGTQLFLSQSSDDGKTWSPNRLVYRSPEGTICQCCHPSLVAKSDGRISVLFRNALGGDRDMYLIDGDEKLNFGPARKLGLGSWKLNACPMDGGMICCNDKDELLSVWRRESKLFTTDPSSDVEHPLGGGEQPWIACSASGPVLAWCLSRDGELYIRNGFQGESKLLAGSGRDPVVASHPKLDFAIACWESRRGPMNTIVAQYVDCSKSNHPMFAEGAKLERLAGDGVGGEGPAWDHELGVLTSGNGNIHRFSLDGKSTVYRKDAHTNGLLFDPQGRLLTCEPGQLRVTRQDRDGSIHILADKFEDQEFNGPNDLSLDSKGRLYFSDPIYGRPRKGELLLDPTLRHEGVYRIDLDGKVTRVLDREVERANGVLVSADDRILYVADNNNDDVNTPNGARKLWKFALLEDGSVRPGSGKVIYDWKRGRGPDGVKQDVLGNLYVAAGLNRSNPPHEPDANIKAGIYVLDPDGKLLDFLAVPTDEVTNCAFGDPDRKSLYITGGGTLYRIRTREAGFFR